MVTVSLSQEFITSQSTYHWAVINQCFFFFFHLKKNSSRQIQLWTSKKKIWDFRDAIPPKPKYLICLLDTVGLTRQRTGFPSLSLLDKDRPRLSRNIVLCIDIQCHAHPYVACKITETSTKRHDQSKHNSHCLYYRISRYFSEDL